MDTFNLRKFLKENKLKEEFEKSNILIDLGSYFEMMNWEGLDEIEPEEKEAVKLTLMGKYSPDEFIEKIGKYWIDHVGGQGISEFIMDILYWNVEQGQITPVDAGEVMIKYYSDKEEPSLTPEDEEYEIIKKDFIRTFKGGDNAPRNENKNPLKECIYDNLRKELIKNAFDMGLVDELVADMGDMEGYLELEAIEMGKIPGFDREAFRQYQYDGTGKYTQEDATKLVKQAQNMVITNLYNI